MILLASPNLRLCILTNLGVSYSIIDVHMLEKNLDIFDNSSLKCDELDYFINKSLIYLYDIVWRNFQPQFCWEESKGYSRKCHSVEKQFLLLDRYSNKAVFNGSTKWLYVYPIHNFHIYVKNFLSKEVVNFWSSEAKKSYDLFCKKNWKQ